MSFSELRYFYFLHKYDNNKTTLRKLNIIFCVIVYALAIDFKNIAVILELSLHLANIIQRFSKEFHFKISFSNDVIM